MNKVMKFDLDPKTLKVKELLNKDFLELEIKAISTAKPNRNGSHFTLESLQNAIPSFYNKPLLGSFSVNQDDFRAHEGDLDYDEELDTLYYDYTDDTSETPLGLIRSTDKVEVYHDKKDGLDWIKFTCAIWVKYNYKQVKKLLKAKDGHKKISVEVEVNDSYIDEDGIEIIKDFTYDGCTILGDKYETGIADAQMTILDMVDNALFAKKAKCLAFAYTTLDTNNKVETPSEVENLNKDSNNNFIDNNAIVNESPEDELTMDNSKGNQEGGKSKAMTYEMKRQLLREAIGGDSWILDFSDDYVIFELYEDNMYINYRAPYTVTESEEGNLITVDLSVKEKVIATWTTYSAEEQEEANKETSNEEFAGEVCPDCGKNPCECESCGGKKEDEACGKCEAESCGDKETEAEDSNPSDDDKDDDSDDSEDDNDDKDDSKEDEACGKCAKCSSEGETFESSEDSTNTVESEATSSNEEFAEIVNPNKEPVIEEKTIEENLIASTESIAAPELQMSAENVGDANAEVVTTMSNVDAEIINDKPDMPANAEGDPAKAEDVISQPDDSAKGEIFEAETSTEEVAKSTEGSEETETFEFNGEQITVQTLIERFNDLQNKYDTLSESVKVQEAKTLAEFAANFINSDTVVDEETKKDYIAQVSEKCENFELTTEEDVTKFAKSLMAMYYYEKQSVQKDNKEFSITIEKTAQIEKVAPNAKLKDSINKLNQLELTKEE